MENLLFDLPEQPKATEIKEKTFYKCKQCFYFFEHQYTRKLTYCKVFKRNNTSYGCKKIKRNNNICEKFELKEK